MCVFRALQLGGRRFSAVAEDVAVLSMQGRLDEALQVLESVEKEGLEVGRGALNSLLQGCVRGKALAHGRRLHRYMMRQGLAEDGFLGAGIVSLYAECGRVGDAHSVFDRLISRRRTFAWNALIKEYARSGPAEKAFELFWQMGKEGAVPDKYTLGSILGACISSGSLDHGRRIHVFIRERGIEVDGYVGNCLLQMYIDCGGIDDGVEMFWSMKKKDVVSWNAVIAGCAHSHRAREAFEIFRRMDEAGVVPDSYTFSSILSLCANVGALKEGMSLHDQIIRRGLETDVFVGNALVDMYSKNGIVEAAYEVFERMPLRDVVSWNTIIAGYVDARQQDRAFEMFEKMRLAAVKANSATFISLLRACCGLAYLEKGQWILSLVREALPCMDMSLNTAVVAMYVRCGSWADAAATFSSMTQRTVHSWTAIMAGCAKLGDIGESLSLFQQMHDEGTEPDKDTFASILNALGSQGALEGGKLVHGCILACEVKIDQLVSNALIDMYVKSGSLDLACQVFDSMPLRDVVSWNTLISGHVQHDRHAEAFELYELMKTEGLLPSRVTFVTILPSVGDLEQGKTLYQDIVERRLEEDFDVQSAMLAMYMKCGSLEDGRTLFDSMPHKTVFTWNVLIAGFVRHGQSKEALELFNCMQKEMEPDKFTYVSVLIACAMAGDCGKGKQIHAQAVRCKASGDLFVSNALVDMYCKCGNIADAVEVFIGMPGRDIVSWNAIITGYVKQGQMQQAWELFMCMESEGVEPDSVTFAIIIDGCMSLDDSERGQELHALVVERNLDTDLLVGNALVGMYGRMGNLNRAEDVFQKMAKRDVVSWNILIGGFVKQGCSQEACNLFQMMQSEGVEPDAFTFCSVLNACADLSILDRGREIHAVVINFGLEKNLIVGTALVDMYAKCGSIEDARQAFYSLPERSVVTWNAMIAGYAQHGLGMEAIHLSQQMQEQRLKPDKVTFISLLSACSHLGLVHAGWELFNSMTKHHGLSPSVEHYTCMVSLLGRAGQLEEAEELVRSRPSQTSSVLWRAFLSACRLHNNLLMAERAAQIVIDLEPDHSSAYVLLASAYAAASRWDDEAAVWKSMKDRGVRKELGRSWIEVDTEVHFFSAETKA